MLIAFVDESYDRDVYHVGAAVGSESQWADVAERLEVIRRRTAATHGTDPEAEFHAHEIMGGSGGWRRLRGRHREAAGVYLAVLRVARDSGIRYLFRGVDVQRLRTRDALRSPHALLLGQLLGDIDRLVENSGPHERARIVADEIATQADHQHAFAGYQVAGLPGQRAVRLGRIDGPITFMRSHASDGLQVVDLAVYVHHRRRRSLVSHPLAVRTLERQWELIESSVVHTEEWVP